MVNKKSSYVKSKKNNSNHFVNLIRYGLVGFLLLILVFIHEYKIEGSKIITVEKGDTVHSIAKLLVKEGLIKDKNLFKVYMYLTLSQNKLKAGEYGFEGSVSIMEIWNKLVMGKVKVNFVTIPEGLTVKQIFELLNKDKRLKGKITEKVTDGDLLPDTYDFTKNTEKDMIIIRMKMAMEKAVYDIWENRNVIARDKNFPVKNKKDLIILASIVEKETSIEVERPIVASVFINRLKKGMKLQTDPTVVYAITDGYGHMKGRKLWSKHLKVNSPYNTYKNRGLPVGAIANPGVSSLKAVLNPADTEYVFFVADGKGGHVFATNLKDHEKNRRKWQKIRDSK